MRASTRLSLAVFWSTAIFCPAAFAQSDPIGAGGRLLLSADRLFGLTFSKLKVEEGDSGDVSTQSRTDVALLWRPLATSPSTIPQIGLDVGVVGGFTLGAALGFFSQSGTNESTPSGGASSSSDSPSMTSFVVAPRAGYGIPILPWLAFWGRLGFTYYNLHSSQESTGNNPTTRESTFGGWNLNLDPMFVFLPAQHFGITAGPYLDLPLSGSTSTDTTQNGITLSPPDDSTKYTGFGLKFGLLGAFL